MTENGSKEFLETLVAQVVVKIDEQKLGADELIRLLSNVTPDLPVWVGHHHNESLKASFYQKLVGAAIDKVEEKSLSNEEFLLLLQGLVITDQAYFKPDHFNIVLNDYIQRLEEDSIDFEAVMSILENVQRYTKSANESLIDTESLVALTTQLQFKKLFESNEVTVG